MSRLSLCCYLENELRRILTFLSHDSYLAVLDLEAIRYGNLREFEITGFNYGLIEAENVTLTWRRYWENCEFRFPSAIPEGEFITIDLGNLAANSSVSVPVEVNILFDVPGDRVTLTGLESATLVPFSDDPSWLTGPSVIVVPYADPIGSKFLVQLDSDGRPEFTYYFSNSSKYTYVYNETDLVDTIIIENATVPEEGRRLLEEEGSEANTASQSVRKLCGPTPDIVGTIKKVGTDLIVKKYFPLLDKFLGSANRIFDVVNGTLGLYSAFHFDSVCTHITYTAFLQPLLLVW